MSDVTTGEVVAKIMLYIGGPTATIAIASMWSAVSNYKKVKLLEENNRLLAAVSTEVETMSRRDLYLQDTDQLCCILDDLQKQLMGARDLANRDTLKGSYGVYLHHLKHKDRTIGQDYHNWMEWYNNKVVGHEKL